MGILSNPQEPADSQAFPFIRLCSGAHLKTRWFRQIPALSPIVTKSMFEVLLVTWALLFVGVVFRQL